MAVISVLGLLLFFYGTLGHTWDNFQPDNDIENIIRGSMGEPVSSNDYTGGREKREVMFKTVDEVIKFLLKQVDTLWSRVQLLEKDNAIFQQTIALVAKITDKKLSQYSCGCLRDMLMADGAVPCEMTTVIKSKPTETSEATEATESSDLTSPVSVTPTLASTQSPESIQYLDFPEVQPLVPGVLGVSYYGNQFYRYIFHNKSIDITATDRKLTYSLAFDPVEEKIIWSSFTPSAIYSSKVDGTNFTTLARDILSYGLAVDSDKHLLFLTTVSPRHAVAVMYTDGSGYRVIAHTGKYGRPSRISLDFKNEIAFVAFRSRIIKVSYDGSQQSVLLRGKYITSLTYDNANAVLYYADRIVIYKVKDTTGDKASPQRIFRFKPKSGSYPSDLLVDGDVMYIGYKFRKTLDVMSLNNKTVSNLATLDGDFVSLCIMR